MTISADQRVIVIGAGVVGCAVAHELSKKGYQVTLVERDLSEPDRIVGELLQPGGVNALKSLGLYACLSKIDAIQNFGYGLFYKDQVVPLPYPKDAEGVSFHHGRFIQRLREACSTRVDMVEATCTSLVTDGSRVVGVNIKRIKQDERLLADLVVVADGCFSKFRGEIEHQPHVVRSNFVGLVLEDCQLPMPNNGHVILAQPSPILLYQIASRDTRILVDVPGRLPSVSSGALKKYMLEYVKPQLPESVQPSFDCALETQRLRCMPNSFLPAVPQNRSGLLIVGDALNMRHPLTGGGMTVGLNDAVILGHLLEGVDLLDESRMSLIKSKFYSARKAHASSINILAQALYALFSAGDDYALQVLQQACFRYLGLGGIFMEHPVGLLTALIKKPIVLYIHFFSVAFYGMGQMMLKPLPVLSEFILGGSDQLSFKGVGGSILALVYYFDLALLIILSAPFNIIISGYVLYVAARIMLPLIWTEVK